MSLLEIEGLKVEFPSRRGHVIAVHDLTITVEPGEILGIVGESGSGKSVTALSIMRLVELGTRGKIEAGEILFRTPDGDRPIVVESPLALDMEAFLDSRAE